jgi:hypothetical protein
MVQAVFTSFYTTTSLCGTFVTLNSIVTIKKSHAKKIKQELEKVTFWLKLKAEEKIAELKIKPYPR